MYRHKRLLLLVLSLLAVVAACGGGGGGGAVPGGEGTIPVETNLKNVFYRTLDNAPVVQITLKRQNGAVIASNLIMFDTRIETANNYLVGPTAFVSTDGNGKGSLALPAGTYPMVITNSTSTFFGNLNDTLTISADLAKTYQTSQQQWIVNAPINISSLDVTIYQTDASGNLNLGTDKRPLNPMVLKITVPISAPGGATQTSFTTELFEGTYRALLRAAPTSTLDTIQTYISPAFSAGGGGATESQIHTLKQSGNIVKLTLKDGANPVPDFSHTVEVYDRTTRIALGSSPTVSGVVVVPTGDFSDVICVIRDWRGALAIRGYTATPTHAADLVMRTIDGTVHPTSGSLELNDFDAVVQAKIISGLDKSFEQYLMMGTIPITAPVSISGTGAYQIKLFDGGYTLLALNVNTFPDSQKISLAVSGNMTGQQINVSVGGVITGRVQDVAKNDIAGVLIEIKDATTNELISYATSNINGSYTASVPYGTYNLLANGAVTRNLTVSASNQTVTQNLTRYTIQGRLVDSSGGGLAGTLFWGGGSQAADGLGTYTINMMQGENWVWFLPPATRPSIGFESATVLIDPSTIASN